jgi:hypothetical protein
VRDLTDVRYITSPFAFNTLRAITGPIDDLALSYI